jgi:chlorobactene glucosyltransferase
VSFLQLAIDVALSAGLFPFVWRGLRGIRAIPALPRPAPSAAAEAPPVAVFVPARNEERSIERCVASLLAQDYPRDRLVVYAVDDRSTDRTPAILECLAASDARLRVLHGAPLPDGWMGKCWALHQAAQQAAPAARYLLFTDADTVHSPAMLSTVVRAAEADADDLLSLGPDQELGSPAERILLPGILGVIMAAYGSIDEVNDPGRPDVAKAVGQFLLFRAEAYRAIGGHEAVRGEIVEDFALARLVKRRGYRLRLADGRGLVRTRMYTSAREIWDGFSKNAFDETQKQPGGAAAGLLLLPVLSVGPHLLSLLALRRVLAGGAGWARLSLLVRLLQTSALLLTGRATARYFGLPVRYALAQPISSLFLWGILANSTWRTQTGRGVTWKGRTY